jgi:hypothetical protein
MSNPGARPQEPDNPGRPTWNPAPAQRPVAAGGSRRRQVIVLVVLVLVTGALLGGVWFATRSHPENAKVGDCVQQTGSDSIKIVNCSDSKADLKVVGRVEDKTRAEAGYGLSTVCDAYQDAEQMFWQGEQGKKGFVLCLAKNSK